MSLSLPSSLNSSIDAVVSPALLVRDVDRQYRAARTEDGAGCDDVPQPEQGVVAMNLFALQAELRHVAAERDWQPFHTPKNLAMALMVEAAELAEIFQWMTPEESRLAHKDVATRVHIGDEIADVLLYLLQVADHSGMRN